MSRRFDMGKLRGLSKKSIAQLERMGIEKRDGWAARPRIPFIASTAPKHGATLWAFCAECKTLHLGVTGAVLVCPHLDEERGIIAKVTPSQLASRVRDSGWRGRIGGE